MMGQFAIRRHLTIRELECSPTLVRNAISAAHDAAELYAREAINVLRGLKTPQAAAADADGQQGREHEPPRQ